MSKKNERLSYLFKRFSDKTATSAELAELQQLVENPDNADEIDMHLRQQWDDSTFIKPIFSETQSGQMLNNILNSQQHTGWGKAANRGRFPWQVRAAAAVVLVVMAVTYNQLRQKPVSASKKAVSKAQLKHDALPGGNHALLKLGNGQTIQLDSARQGLITRQGGIEVKKAADGQLAYRVIKTGNVAQGSIINTLTVPRGGQYQIILADGTKVWLNSASSLKFPTLFTGKYREVEITGEAYFEVAKDAARPFKVKVSDAEIQVLGTHFNVKAYAEEDEIKTTLLEGSVKLTSGRSNATLTPGEQGRIKTDGALSVKQHVDLDAEVAWKNGLFSFNDDRITDVMLQIERWYDVKVSYEGAIPAKRLTGTISRNVKASELLNMLSYTGVNFKINGKQITVTN